MTMMQAATARRSERDAFYDRNGGFNKLRCYLKTLGLITMVGVSASLAMPMGKAQARGDFSKTCTNLNVQSADFSNTASLTAGCTNQHGKSVPASINLNDLIADDQDGNMAWASHGHFQRSCRHSFIENPFDEPKPHNLAAFCRTASGSEVETDIDLDQHIANINGKLMFVP